MTDPDTAANQATPIRMAAAHNGSAALVGAVDFNASHFARQSFDCVIAVDRGYASLESAGFTPDMVVGDFDSLGYVPTCENVSLFPSEKDKSDMELAILAAEEAGCDTLVFYGALSGRLDHTLANIQLMIGCARRGITIVGVGDSFAVVALDGKSCNTVFFDAFDPRPLDAGEYGRFISAFAFGGSATGVCESGLKYTLNQAIVPDDASLGLSNQFIGKPARISVGQGNLIVMFPLGVWDSMHLGI